ncbi:phosphonate metabolism transcriptional regulator PhnF [Magnetovibrio blakemorei]|uniref:Phosphonate metabolism transcriptional regulator PhnF n=1 Tax=Magnetovibrio blakemorei TaxID=28181 RepID=A0A1E5Q4H1_9PROT|nr:phosphonate metabolism transcriptional regulator PhnF [Magnetovibrio blakemorei]OEJ65066.1 phosphonate metabolism transcriptional regulator PhnF [Magnetovibrio blakemorei]
MKRGIGISLWRQIHEQLKTDIVKGLIKPGDMLPTEHTLAARFDVNRHTVRRAIQALGETGLVITRQGSGTYVPETVVDYAVKKRTRFSETVSEQSRVPTLQVIESFTQVANAKQAKVLELNRGARVLCIRTLGGADTTPLSLADHYFAAGRFPDMARVVERCGSISIALKEFGVEDFSRQSTRVTARMPNREQADLLQQPIQRPVLMAESVNVTADGKPLEYGRTLFAGDRVQMVFEPG